MEDNHFKRFSVFLNRFSLNIGRDWFYLQDTHREVIR